MSKRKPKAPAPGQAAGRPADAPPALLGEPGPAGRAVLVLGPEGAGALAAELLAALGCDRPRPPAGQGPGGWAWEGRAGLARPDAAPDPGPDPAQRRAALEAAFGAAPMPLLRGEALGEALPAWLAALAATGRGAVAVLAHGLPPAGADGEDEAAWSDWARGALGAERASRGLRRAVCDRDRVLSDWRGEADRLAARLHLDRPAPAEGEAGIEALVAAARAAEPAATPGPAETSNPAASRPPGRPPGRAVRRLAEVLARWAERGEDPADHPELDRVARKLGVAGPADPPGDGLAGELASAALAGVRSALREAGDAEEARAEAERWLAEATARLVRSERLRLDAAGAAATAADEALGAQAALEDRIERLKADLAAAGHERDHLASALRQSRHEASEHHEARAELAGRLAALEAELAALRAERDEARAAHGADLRRMARLRQDVATLKRDALGELSARLATLPGLLAERPGPGAAPPREEPAAPADGERGSGTRSDEVAALAARLRDAERRAEAARAEAEAIRRSASWRLTTPLRSALRVLRRT